jgi:hypothetical protein
MELRHPPRADGQFLAWHPPAALPLHRAASNDHGMSAAVICVKMGTQYGPEYVRRLEAMVRRHAPGLEAFYCLTDDPVGLTCQTIRVPTTPGTWWAKLRLFSLPLKVPLLYLDLDTVIVQSLDPLLAYDGPLCLLQGWGSADFNSSVMAIGPGAGRAIWESYAADRPRIERDFSGDQAWITHMVPEAHTWPAGLIGSYKRDGLAESPRDFHVVCFHGTPKPHQCDGWVAEHWR